MSGQGDPTPRDYPAGLLHRHYLVALALVASLVLLDQVLVQPSLLQLTTDPPVINVAGRQRMLSQQLVKGSLALDMVADEVDRRRHLAELGRVLRQWSAIHEALRHGDRRLSPPGRNSAAVRQAFEDLEPFFTTMRAAVARLIRDGGDRRPDAATARADLATILEVEGEYLARMDRIVGLYERETQARVDRLLWTGWAMTALILVALVGIGLFILRPASRVIQRQIVELCQARDALEDRVRERTRALELANRDLEREMAVRSMAEQRQRALVEQFSHVARTTTIGEMASGLAHELNQPLGAIANYAEGCLVALDAPDPALDDVRGALEKILAATLRAGEIIRRIRRFVTRHEIGQEVFAPNRVAEEVEELFRDEARRRGIALAMQLAPDLPNHRGDPVQIQQVLVNLVRNAFESLTVSETVNPTIVMHTRRVDRGDVEFGVTDNGEGIPGDRLEKVFDAYFSTRAEGMGMGLAISRTIIEAHHGRIAAESLPGLRTTFRFSLPPAGVDDA